MSTLEERIVKYHEDAERYELFDANLWWAPEYVDTFHPYTDWQEQLADMRAHGLNGGFVTAQTSRVDPWVGNEEVLEAISGTEGYYAGAVLVPEMFFREEEGLAYLKDLKARGVIGIRLYPGNFNHSMKEYSIGRILSALEKEKLPLIVWHIDTGFDAIDEICTNHPGLNVLLDTGERKMLYHARDYIPLMMQHKNFFIENHNLVLHDEYEVIRDLGCVDQILFGSDFPYFNLDFSIYPVTMADMPEGEIQKIFAGNAKGFFGI